MANPPFGTPGERIWLCPPGQMGKNGWVSKKSVYFANFNSCLRVRLSSHSAFALALVDLKNSQMAVLASGTPYALATNSLSNQLDPLACLLQSWGLAFPVLLVGG